MTPEKTEMALRAMIGSLAGFIAELETWQGKCPIEAQHLLSAMRQTKVSLEQLIARSPD